LNADQLTGFIEVIDPVAERIERHGRQLIQGRPQPQRG
jgi:hypothetical protein